MAVICCYLDRTNYKVLKFHVNKLCLLKRLPLLSGALRYALDFKASNTVVIF